MYDTLILPVDKYHVLKKAEFGWDYTVQENANIKKTYYLYPNEVDNESYNFDGYKSDVKDLQGGIIVDFHSDEDRISTTYNMKGQVVREDKLSMLQIYENLSRCTSSLVVDKLKEKKASAKKLLKLQSVTLPLDDQHKVAQTDMGLWRYTSGPSKRVYVFYLSEIKDDKNEITISLFDRPVRVYENKEPKIYSAKDVIIYLITREKELYFDDCVEFPMNLSMIVNRRGWGRYIHFLDNEMKIHAFKLNDNDETPEKIPHILDLTHAVTTQGFVKLCSGSYEDLLVVDGEYIPQNVFYSAKRLATPRYDSKFYDQKGLIEKYCHKQGRFSRNVELRR